MKLAPYVVMRENADGTGIVFNPDSRQVMELNAAGVILWKAFEKGAGIAEAARQLISFFEGVSREQAEADTRKFVAALTERALLTP